MDDPSIKKRLIDFGTDEHEYDEVQDIPEEPNNQQSTSKAAIQNNYSENNNGKQPTSDDIPPELPPPKQKSVKNSKNKQKQQKTTTGKSKIPRSPSLASSLSSLASSLHSGISGGNSNNSSSNNNNNIPPQTPPLPAGYQQQNKAKYHMNGSGSAITTTTPAATPTTSTNNNVNNLSAGVSSSSNNNNIMGGSVQLSQTSVTNAGSSNVGTGGGVAGQQQQQLQQQRSSLNLSAASRRPQIQITPISEMPTPVTSTSPQKHFQYLTLTVRKDEIGYGMKVSGDNPVFVESVKPGGAAQIAGLVAGDMILKVNGQEVRSEKHPTVVSLIKASTTVELSVKRSQKMTRPTSVGIVPSTPILSGRDRTASITGPQPVDSIKRREMETYKIQTLQKMLEEEKLNLEKLKGDTNNPSYKLSEANIRKLREQLRQVGAEDAPTIKYQPTTNSNKNTAMLSPNQIQHLSTSTTSNNNNNNNKSHQQFHLHQLHHHHSNSHHQQATTPQPQPAHSSSPAFLSLLPRSLSSLSLVTRKNKIDKDSFISSPITTNNTTTDFLQKNLQHHQHQQQLQQQHHNNIASPIMSQSLHQTSTTSQLQRLLRNSPPPYFEQSQTTNAKDVASSKANSKSKNKFAVSKSLIEEDIPPPLPQRNQPRQFANDLNNGNHNSKELISNTNTNQLFAPISDLDRAASPQSATPCQTPQSSKQAAVAAKSKRSKTKTKALSDPKMSTQLFLQMETISGQGGCVGGISGSSEVDCVPPPLPPRQPGMLEELALSHNRGSCQNLNTSGSSRPPPNSISTVFNYPLVSTCTAVQTDNMSAAFPLSQRPNIVQQLQQHQQQQHQQQQQQQQGQGSGSAVLGQTPHNLSHIRHRRVVSSPENMHPRHPDRLVKTTSGSWELVEKDNEVTPPGTPPPPYLTSSNMSVPEDPNECLSASGGGGGGIFIESHHFTPLTGALSPPSGATLHSSRIQAAQSCDTQKEIISMEDESTSDQEEQFIDENGPFNNLTRLLENENVVFLAVFLNYILSNSEPAPLLFYLITELYKEGTAKDMRKWAYEIHSTFLVPRAPLALFQHDMALAREVDNVLQSEFDKVEILRTVFLRSRRRAKEIITEQLRDFQQKRTAGLGTIYGPTDAQLTEAKSDKQREHIIDETLMRKLQSLIEEYEKDSPAEDPRKLALCSALSTVIHRIFNTRSHQNNNLVDRVHQFVSREKSFKSRLMGKNRKMIVRGHPLVLRQYYEVTNCNHCQTIIWGVSPQGYHCTDCKLNIHRPCSKTLDENCPGPLPQAKRNPHNDNKISKFMGKIRPRTSNDFIAMERRQRQDEDFDAELINERLHSSSITRQPSDRRPDANISLRSNGNASANNSAINSSDLQNSFHATSANDSASASAADSSASGVLLSAGGLTSAGAASSVDLNAQDAAAGATANESKDARRERYHQNTPTNRSESFKECRSNKRNRNSRRKTSDPSLTSRPNDDQADLGLSNSNYTASSNSSLSSGGGSESPSTSMEQVGGVSSVASVGAAGAAGAWHQHHAHTATAQHTHQHSHQDSFHGSVGSASSNNTSFWGSQPTQRQWNFDSDEDDDLNEADWSSKVAAEMLAKLTDAEKKRQEIINEIYQTERSHVRTLKLLDRLFFCPLSDSGLLTQDHLTLLFPPALPSLRELHGTFEQKLKQRRIEHNHVVNHIGDLLAGMFDGQSGEELREHAGQFCARQQIALEALKEKRRKDEQLQKLLSKSESHKACRRLQLKDLLPTVLQRLTKYPLLFENLYKVTIRVVPDDTSEADAIQRALESSKKILVEVNQAVKTAEDAHKLQNIQRKLDKSPSDEFKNFDLTQHRLIHDGNLTLKKNQSIQLHGLLFENMIVLLTKQDDKYSLKYLNIPILVNNKPVNPIMSIDSETLVRQEAADKNSFFLIKTKTSQMLELRAPSSSECKTWFKHISDAAEQYKPRSKSNTNSHEPVDDPAIATLPHSNTKESLELAPERPPMAATATVTTTPLAPMLPIATVTPAAGVSSTNNNYSDVQFRNGRRESTPMSSSDNGVYYNLIGNKQRLSHNELSSAGANSGGSSLSAAVNRTMSTRSCGEPNTHYGAGLESNGITLRHTQSARQANGQIGCSGDDVASTYSLIGGPSKRDSASIVFSNNSNNTRTLLMQSPLVDPTAIQISISPAHTAEPVLTPSEKLRRLDAAIRDGLLEKQKIICDMFRLPVEHFNEIVDIAAMPEAPKDSADIALAAYDQVQSLTKVLNEYMHVTPEQEISAVSIAVCDHCHEKQQHPHIHQQQQQQQSKATGPSTDTPITTTALNECSAIVRAEKSPPPLPPPNKQPAQQQTPAKKSMPKMQTPTLEETINIREDDDGYCEIDELRLPALTIPNKATTTLAPFKVPPVSSANSTTPVTPPVTATATTPELVKRQSTISADSIPEESADEVSKALNEGVAQKQQSTKDSKTVTEAHPIMDAKDDAIQNSKDAAKAAEETSKSEKQNVENSHLDNVNTTANSSVDKDPQMENTETDNDGSALDEFQQQKSADIDIITDELSSDFIEINDVYDTLVALNKVQASLSMVDNSSQTANLPTTTGTNNNFSEKKTVVAATGTTCGPNRIQHANSLEPSVPCYALSSIVSALNEQISLLLPKINERDIERERLRKENQHLRELLSAMHESQRVETKGATPTDIRTILNAADEAFDDEIDAASSTSLTPTPTPLPTTPTATLTEESSSATTKTLETTN